MIFSVPLLGILIPAQEILKPTIFSVLITNKQTLGNFFFFFALHLDLAWSFIAYALLVIWSDFKSFGLNWQSCHEMFKKKNFSKSLVSCLSFAFSCLSALSLNERWIMGFSDWPTFGWLCVILTTATVFFPNGLSHTFDSVFLKNWISYCLTLSQMSTAPSDGR